MLGIVYFYDQEAEYETWLNENRKTGLVINNLRGEIPKPWKPNEKDGGLKLHKASCTELNSPRHAGARTIPYGKLCGIDEQVLLEDCERRSGGYRPKRCAQPSRDCFG